MAGRSPLRRGHWGRKLSARSVRKAYVVLSRVLGFAVKAHRLAFNPAAGVPLPKAAPAEHVYLDELQVEALAKATGQYGLFIRLLAYTGLRWGEATALRVGRVDLDARRAHIVEAYANDNGKLYLDTPKNHERRSVPLPKFLVDDLTSHITHRGPRSRRTAVHGPARRPAPRRKFPPTLL
ncbi:tyrosine-type recombinase/integrase [Actinacidiphila oryziradicis]|uniref:tyrosine-type recombinase/integrase n=1 Tax=Actinacidiphila oryziradicis TaxID=2571141 RepID=UPI001FEC9C98|nr:tyrosine-type recombinase/integrase [Actinacidiphila oryziradicis]